MNSNNYNLNPQEVSMLFDEIYLVKEKDFSIQINHLGSNNAKVLHCIYLQKNDANFNKTVEFIYTVSQKGIKINREDLAIINLADYNNLTINNLHNYFMCNYIIFWDCAAWPGLKNTSFTPNSNLLINGINCIFTSNPLIIAADGELKKILWAILKRVFLI